MSQESINKALQKTLLSPLTYDELWSQFLESISYELQNMRDKYGLIKTTWDINYNNKDRIDKNDSKIYERSVKRSKKSL